MHEVSALSYRSRKDEELERNTEFRVFISLSILYHQSQLETI